MISSIDYCNFRVLRSTALPLAPCTLIVGPNGSGKSTALAPLDSERRRALSYARVVSAGANLSEAVKVTINFDGEPRTPIELVWERSAADRDHRTKSQENDAREQELDGVLGAIGVFELSPAAIAEPVRLEPDLVLGRDGANLAGVLDQINQTDPERFQALLDEFQRWLPEYDRILTPTSEAGTKVIRVRRRIGGHVIDARDLSHGTLFALALLTLAYLPAPPKVVCLEDVDHGLHPRLMRHVRDAMYRLAYPETTGEKRAAVQVIATTHSPHLLDFFKDHPEEVVIAEKRDSDAIFRRLSDDPHIDEILEGTSLGEVWYSGALGGVPIGT